MRPEGLDLPPAPTGDTVRKADAMMARTASGAAWCVELECERLADDEDGLCLWHRERV
jgi:hypothetical protein